MVATNLENEYKKFEDLINSYLTVDQSEIVKKLMILLKMLMETKFDLQETGL